MVTLTERQRQFTALVQQDYGASRTFVTRQEMLDVCKKHSLPTQSWLKDPQWKIGRGLYKLPGTEGVVPPAVLNNQPSSDDEEDGDEDTVVIATQPAAPAAPAVIVNRQPDHNPALVPPTDQTFVPFGAYEDVSDIIKSRAFFPVFLTGPTRSGKTLIPLQVCGEQKRHLYRANITIETDESDLIGGYRLVDGNTVWEDGPAVLAAEDPNGGVLLLDEISFGDNKILCLQPLLEGKGMYIKKQKRWVHPAPGFNIIATDNTKGRGSDSGKYVGTNVMNEAMLERFAVTYEQGYPDKATEKKILKNNLALHNMESPQFIEHLCQWAENIRKTEADGGTDEVITTGRLVHIINAYAIFGRNRIKAIKQTLARFDVTTQSSFLDVYTKIDPNAKDGPDTAPALPHHSTNPPPRKPW